MAYWRVWHPERGDVRFGESCHFWLITEALLFLQELALFTGRPAGWTRITGLKCASRSITLFVPVDAFLPDALLVEALPTFLHHVQLWPAHSPGLRQPAAEREERLRMRPQGHLSGDQCRRPGGFGHVASRPALRHQSAEVIQGDIEFRWDPQGYRGDLPAGGGGLGFTYRGSSSGRGDLQQDPAAWRPGAAASAPAVARCGDHLRVCKTAGADTDLREQVWCNGVMRCRTAVDCTTLQSVFVLRHKV